MNIGGTGATLGLNILMLFSKNKSTKKLGQLAILPSVLNINAPIIFGSPILLIQFFSSRKFSECSNCLCSTWSWFSSDTLDICSVHIYSSTRKCTFSSPGSEGNDSNSYINCHRHNYLGAFLKMHERNLSSKNSMEVRSLDL